MSPAVNREAGPQQAAGTIPNELPSPVAAPKAVARIETTVTPSIQHLDRRTRNLLNSSLKAAKETRGYRGVVRNREDTSHMPNDLFLQYVCDTARSMGMDPGGFTSLVDRQASRMEYKKVGSITPDVLEQVPAEVKERGDTAVLAEANRIVKGIYGEIAKQFSTDQVRVEQGRMARALWDGLFEGQLSDVDYRQILQLSRQRGRISGGEKEFLQRTMGYFKALREAGEVKVLPTGAEPKETEILSELVLKEMEDVWLQQGTANSLDDFIKAHTVSLLGQSENPMQAILESGLIRETDTTAKLEGHNWRVDTGVRMDEHRRLYPEFTGANYSTLHGALRLADHVIGQRYNELLAGDFKRPTETGIESSVVRTITDGGESPTPGARLESDTQYKPSFVEAGEAPPTNPRVETKVYPGGSAATIEGEAQATPELTAMEEREFNALVNVGLASEAIDPGHAKFMGGQFALETSIYEDVLDDRIAGREPERTDVRTMTRGFETKAELIKAAKEYDRIRERWDDIMEAYSTAEREFNALREAGVIKGVFDAWREKGKYELGVDVLWFHREGDEDNSHKQEVKQYNTKHEVLEAARARAKDIGDYDWIMETYGKTSP